MKKLFGMVLGLALFALALPCAFGKDEARVTHLRCEYEVNPLGIDVLKPRLSWVMEAPGRGQKQTAYQVLASSSAEKLKAGQGDLWDSGKVSSDQSTQVVYAGKALGSRQRCWWKVTIWDKDGKSLVSEPAFWEMGLLEPTDWQGQWITCDVAPKVDLPNVQNSSWVWTQEAAGGEPPEGERYFRKEFTLPADARVKEAHVHLTVDDQFTAYVKGKEIGKSSGQTDAWRQLMTFDVKSHLTAGANVLAVAANNTGHAAGVIARVAIELEDGKRIEVVSDGSWKSSNQKADGWDKPGFKDDGWAAVKELAKYGSGPWGAFVGGGGVLGAGRQLRKGFELTKAIKQARLYATSVGLYVPYLNGQRIGDHIFAPGWTNYHIRTMYQTYDVTQQMAKGANVLAALLGDGWYCGFVGLGGRNRYGAPLPAFRAQLVVDYTDGTSETIATDTTWKGAIGPILASDLLMGETYDARKEMPGWNKAGFDDADWSAATAREVKTKLEAQRGPPVRKLHELAAKSVKKVGDSYVVDLGQNMVGWARLKVHGQAGTTVTLRFAEMLNPDGSIYTTNLRGAKCTDHYTLKGGGEEVYEPTFTFHGFRYVGVQDYPGELKPDAITGVVVYSDTPPVGSFECSDPRVNQLQSNIIWGQRGNFLSVPTDCPQRDERLGWMGDAQVFIRTASHNMDVASFFTKWLIDVDDAQGGDGDYPDVAPRVAAGGGTAAWGDAGVICPWTVYLCYGDKRILEDHYAGMVKWVEHCRRHSNNLIREKAGSNYGDWLSIGANTPIDVLSTAYFGYSTELLAKSAAIIGKEEDAKKYGQLFEDIKAAYNKAFVEADGRIKGNTQSCYLMALYFHLLPEDKIPLAAKYLAEDVTQRKHLSTGFVGVSYLCPTLTQYGHNDLAYQLLLTETFPSWLFSVKHGATTIWERWDGWTPERGFQDAGMNSFNHYSLGSVGQWMFETVAGIAPDPDQPGYKHIILHPQPGPGLTWAKCSYESMYGKIATSWKKEGNALTLDVTLPCNTKTTLCIPCTDVAKVTESGKPATKAEGLKFVKMENGAAVFDAAPGSYSFKVE